jgi:hypothetical protein
MSDADMSSKGKDRGNNGVSPSMPDGGNDTTLHEYPEVKGSHAMWEMSLRSSYKCANVQMHHLTASHLIRLIPASGNTLASPPYVCLFQIGSVQFPS